MKKIITFLISTIYIIVSILFAKNFSIKEVNNTINNFTDKVSIVDWNKDTNTKEKLNKIEELAQKENINIYKIVYKPKKDTNKQTIIIYSAIGNQEKFNNKFKIKNGRSLNKNDSSESYLSTINNNDISQIGQLNLFQRNYIIELKLMSSADEENIRGNYYIDTDNSQNIELIKEYLKKDLGFELSEANNSVQVLNENNIKENIVVVVSIILLMILISILYYILLNFKELAIKKMFGFSNRNLIFKSIIKEIVKLYIKSLICISLIQGIIIYFYNEGANIFEYYSWWIIIQLIVVLICTLISISPSFVVYKIEVSEMLKNKKPVRFMQALNYISKIVISVCLFSMITNLTNNYIEFKNQNSNKEIWENTKNYSFYEYKYDFSNYSSDKRLQLSHELSEKSKKLFKINNDNGAILAVPSETILNPYLKDMSGDVKDYNPNSGINIKINPNYLKENTIYDTEGNKIKIDNDYGDYLIILVPEKYRNEEKDIKAVYQKWYQNRRFLDEDIYNESIGNPKETHKEVEVKLIYTKNSQKCFSYNFNINSKNNNYIDDPILIVINSENMGADCYLSYMTGGTFFPYVNDIENAYTELSNEISSVGLQNEIISTPLLYSRVDEYIYNLNNTINIQIFSVTVLGILELIISIFISLNYIERKKYKNSILMIHGYSFYKRHYIFFISIFLSFIPIYVFGILRNTGIKYVLIYSIIECILTYLIIKVLENKKTRNVLKGE